MKFKKKYKCNDCGREYHNLKAFKGKFLCWKCYLKCIHKIMFKLDRIGNDKRYLRHFLESVTTIQTKERYLNRHILKKA